MFENSPTLSACLIVRDASKYLLRCLKSIQLFVDEIVIVDTGSMDETLEISRKFTDKIYFFEWIDDFAAARNFALSKVTGDWILRIDADEYLHPTSKNYIKNLLSNPDVIAYSCWLQYTSEFTPETLNYFLFRNHQNLRYSGIIHENLVQSLKINMEETGLKIEQCKLFIEHTGWENDKIPKYDRDLDLLKKAVSEDIGNADLWNRMALIYHHTGKADLAKSINKKACKLIIDQKSFAPQEANAFALAFVLHTNDAAFLNEIIEIALEYYPNNPTFFYVRAKSFIREKRFDQAIELFHKLIEMGKTRDFDHSIAHQLNIFDEYAYGGIADCQLSMKNFSEAALYYKKALAFSEKLEYRVKYNLSKNLAK